MHWSYCDTGRFCERSLREAYVSLSPSRKAHIDRLRQQEDKRRSLTAELLVQNLLQQHYGITSAVVHRKPNGQPYLEGCNLHISISHSGLMVACAVSEGPVGIDIEQIRPVNLKLCRHFCVDAEKDYLLSGKPEPEDPECDDPKILDRFFEIWTAKEAYFKKCGTGITDLKAVNILELKREMHKLERYILHII